MSTHPLARGTYHIDMASDQDKHVTNVAGTDQIEPKYRAAEADRRWQLAPFGKGYRISKDGYHASAPYPDLFTTVTLEQNKCDWVIEEDLGVYRIRLAGRDLYWTEYRPRHDLHMFRLEGLSRDPDKQHFRFTLISVNETDAPEET